MNFNLLIVKLIIYLKGIITQIIFHFIEVLNKLLQLLDRILLKNKNNNFIYFPFSSMTMINKLKLKFLQIVKIFFFNEIEDIEK